MSCIKLLTHDIDYGAANNTFLYTEKKRTVHGHPISYRNVLLENFQGRSSLLENYTAFETNCLYVFQDPCRVKNANS
jgi:hypothetical protein